MQEYFRAVQTSGPKMLIYSGFMNRFRSKTAMTSHDPAGWTHGSPLQIHHAECEVNFLRLQKLLPGFEVGQTRRIGALPVGEHHDVLEVRVHERSPYTAELRVLQKRPVWGRHASEFRVRVYLDAKMAEVTGSARVLRLLPRYEYPNANGMARDEKWQSNRLLGEWLSRCLSDGHELADAAAIAVDG